MYVVDSWFCMLLPVSAAGPLLTGKKRTTRRWLTYQIPKNLGVSRRRLGYQI
jgi:hypothetical protein